MTMEPNQFAVTHIEELPKGYFQLRSRDTGDLMYATLYEPNKDGKEFQYPEPAKDEGKFTTRNVYKLINVKGQRE